MRSPPPRWNGRRCVLLCLVAACGQPATGPGAPSAARPPPLPVRPSARDLFEALQRQGTTVLGLDESCRGVTDRASDTTIGQYVAHLLGQLAEDDPATGGANRLRASCDPAPDDASTLRCRMEVHIDPEGDSPWRYGIELELRRRDGSIVPRSVRCPGGA